MKKKILMIILLGALLGACSSTGGSRQGPSATVEDRSTSASTSAGDSGESGATAFGTGQDSRSGMSALDDPQSLLSERIIHFEYDSSEVQERYRQVVEAHALYLVANPDETLTLEGHADERGSREYNLALGERRALSVKRQMTLLGAAPSQIRTVSYGEERPVETGHDEYAWSQNRRVELIY